MNVPYGIVISKDLILTPCPEDDEECLLISKSVKSMFQKRYMRLYLIVERIFFKTLA